MIIQVKIKTELIEWVADYTGMDRVEAEDFTKQFAGMLYFTGAFEGIGPIGGKAHSQGSPAQLHPEALEGV